MLRVTSLLILTCSLAAPASAQSRAEIDAAITALGSDDHDTVQGGIETLGLLGSPRAVQPISQRIRRGLPPDLLEIAVDTLSILGRTEAGPVLFELTSHRRAGVRLKAIQGIAATHPPGADRALIAALSDTDAAVRSSAAEGLGTLGATSGLDALFHAMDRHIPEAAVSIGQLARPQDVARFLEYLGRLPFDQVTPALSEMLNRERLQERARLSIIHRLTELATPEVRTFLESFVQSLPPDDRSAVRRAAQDAIPRISQ